jgi:succinoglycan biosynthesis transport protein ExoP
MESSIHADQGNPEDKLLTIGDIVAFFGRKKKVILATVGVCLFLAILYCLFATRRYQSEALMEVRQPEDSLGLNSLVQGGSAQPAQPPNPLEETVTLATKVQELQSDDLDLQVIDRLHLQDTEDFKPSFDPIGLILNLFAAPTKKDSPGTTFLNSPSRRARALIVFNRHLKVEVVAGTRLISIKYANPNADLAARVVNELANDLARYGYDIKYKTTQQLSGWLADQLDTVRKQAEDLQEREARLRRETESYSIGTNGAGQPSIYNPVIDQLQQATSALNQAQSNRILRTAVAEIVKTRDPQLISGLAGSGMLGSGNPQSTTSLDLINSLQGQIATQQAAVNSDEVVFGDSYPKLIQDRAQLQSLRSALQSEINRLATRAANDEMIAKEQEERTRSDHDGLLRRANTVNDKYLQYQIVQQEAQDARQFYTELNQRLREVSVTVGMLATDTTLFAPGLAPYKPHYPRTVIVLVASIVAGAFLGVLVGIFLEFRNDKISSIRALESVPGTQVLGLTPDFTVGKAHNGSADLPGPGDASRSITTAASTIDVLREPDSLYAAAMRSLRVALLLSPWDEVPKAILVTSSRAEEGKSVTAINLAATFARAGARVLLVEADIQNPALAQKLRLAPSSGGLSQMLTGQLPPERTTNAPGISNLHLIPAGDGAREWHELINSDAMSRLLAIWRKNYEVILIDGPPILPSGESVLLINQVDLTLLVTRYGITSVSALQRVYRLIPQRLHAQIGVLLNAVSPRSEAYREYYGYREGDYVYQEPIQQGEPSRG